jgi:hypothetical protein
MSRLPWRIAALLELLLISLLTAAAGQASFKIEAAGPPRTEVPRELRNRLEADGTRLFRTVNGIDIPLAELWWVRSLPLHPSAKTAAGYYRELTPGRMLAVLYLPTALEDVQNQKIPPGFYTLRYAHFDPEKDARESEEKEKEKEDKREGEEDDKHSVVKYDDYVLLARLESDKRIDSSLKPAKMLELSRQVSPGRKPAMLALSPLNLVYKAFPYAVSDDLGHCAVQFKLPVKFGFGQRSEMRIAIILVNPPNVSAED